jgi:hypothetical protein
MNSLVELFCAFDDFCKVFVPLWQNNCSRAERDNDYENEV